MLCKLEPHQKKFSTIKIIIFNYLKKITVFGTKVLTLTGSIATKKKVTLYKGQLYIV